jgi:hypothetical protein
VQRQREQPLLWSFYQWLWKLAPRSEVVSKTKQRVEKYRDTLFTFLEYEGVPWNNNNAEHAVKAFATLRRVIKGVTSEAGLRDYLLLLNICETCNYQGLDFLAFLRSGETDIAVFADSRQKRSSLEKSRSTKRGRSAVLKNEEDCDRLQPWYLRSIILVISTARDNTRCVQLRFGVRETDSPSWRTSKPAANCLCYVALAQWHLGEVASSKATMTEAISLAEALLIGLRSKSSLVSRPG